jgi:hypothetical protein
MGTGSLSVSTIQRTLPPISDPCRHRSIDGSAASPISERARTRRVPSQLHGVVRIVVLTPCSVSESINSQIAGTARTDFRCANFSAARSRVVRSVDCSCQINPRGDTGRSRGWTTGDSSPRSRASPSRSNLPLSLFAQAIERGTEYRRCAMCSTRMEISLDQHPPSGHHHVRSSRRS